MSAVPLWYREGVKEDMHLRIDAEIMRGVREYAAERGVSLAAAVSILLRRALYEELDRP